MLLDADVYTLKHQARRSRLLNRSRIKRTVLPAEGSLALPLLSRASNLDAPISLSQKVKSVVKDKGVDIRCRLPVPGSEACAQCPPS